jgi:triacylglycerol lipase
MRAAAILFTLTCAAPVFGQAPSSAGAIQEGDARVYGQVIHYRESGSSGPVVILLHGLGADSGQWLFTMPALAGYHVYAPDHLGFGKSDKPVLNYRVQTLVDMLDGFCRERGIQKATLVGNSMGGWVALAFALQHPDKVDKLVLVDSSGYSNARWGGPAPTREALVNLNPATISGLRNLLALNFANQQLVNDVTVQAAFARRLAAGDGQAIGALTESVLRGEDFVDGKLGALKAPTLIVWGREDGLLPLAVAEAFAHDISGSRLAVLDRCGHLPPVECPVPFAVALLPFLK